MPKISVIKLILCDLLSSHFKRQIDNIKRNAKLIILRVSCFGWETEAILSGVFL